MPSPPAVLDHPGDVESEDMTWGDVVARLGGAHEVDVIVPAAGRPVVRVPIWLVAVDGVLYARSWKGAGGVWYRRALRHRTGSLGLDGAEHPVRFVPVTDPALDARIDQAYRDKYAGSPYAEAMVRPPATGTTLRVESA
jgi:hypothetical protein